MPKPQVMNWKIDQAIPIEGIKIDLTPSAFGYRTYRYYRFEIHFNYEKHRQFYKRIRFSDNRGHDANIAKRHVREWFEREKESIVAEYKKFVANIVHMQGVGSLRLINEKSEILAKINRNDASFAIQKAEYYRQCDEARDGRRMKSVVTGRYQVKTDCVEYGSSVVTRQGRVSAPNRYYTHVEDKYTSIKVPDYPDEPRRYDDNNELHRRLREINAELVKYGIV